MKLRLEVTPNHRFAEVPVRTKKGKVWVGQYKATTVDTKDLLPGEEVTIRRYEEEGRLKVSEVRARKGK